MSNRSIRREARIGILLLRYLHGLTSFFRGRITEEEQGRNEAALAGDLAKEGIRASVYEGELNFSPAEEAKTEATAEAEAPAV